MWLFGKKEKPKTEGKAVPHEILESIRVMQDDLDDLHGKKKQPASETGSEDAVASNHPFLGSNASVQKAPPLPEQALPGKTALASVGARKKWLIAGVFVALFLSVGIVSVLVVSRNSKLNSDTFEDIEELETPSDSAAADSYEPISVLQEESVFSLENPNIIQIDPETDGSTPEGILVKLDALREEAAKTTSPVPMEFLIRDMNNHPIAFSRIVYLLGLRVPETLLSSLDEPFALYLVPDKGILYIALSVDIRDSALFESEMGKNEQAAPSWLSEVLYRPFRMTAPEGGVFSNGSYGAIPTRYAVLDPVAGVSFDYAVVGNRFVVGTSKDSFRAVLDKVMQNGLK